MTHQVLTSRFKNVERLYPNAIIKGIKQMSYKNKGGWVDAPNIINSGMNDFVQVLEHLESIGIESIQLCIEDDYKQLKHPDYKLKELI